MAITDPKKPWAVVCQSLDGTSPPDTIPRTLDRLFTLGEYGGTSLADFFQVQTMGQVDLTGSLVYPDWQSSGWSIETYPGLTKDTSGDLIDHSKKLVPDFGRDYRGVVAVSNHPCGGRQYGNDVLWGVNGYGSTPAWADNTWRQCKKCRQLARSTRSGIWSSLGRFPCAGGGTHDLDARKYMTVTDTKVPSVRTIDVCTYCGVLFASDVASSASTECPGGPMTAHVGSGAGLRILAGWVDPPAEREWSVCSQCRAITPDGALTPCPARSDGHVKMTLSAVHFPFEQIPSLTDLSPRGFLAHEMSHCYGFPHGRGIEPRNYAVGECWPSGYGDPFDIMSYANCQSYWPAVGDADAGLGRAGPGLTLAQLLRSDVLTIQDLEDATVGSARPEIRVILRPLTESGTGSVGATFGDYVVEFRRRRFFDPFTSVIHGRTVLVPSRYRWDRNIQTLPDQSGAVLIHFVSRTAADERPNLVPSMRANQYLGEGDFFECRDGMGDTRVFVDRINHDGGSASVTFTHLAGERHFKRWLVVPYRASDSSGSYDRKKLDSVVAATEEFWTDMAGPAFWTTGTYVLTSDKDPGGNGCITVQQTVAQLSALSAEDRASAVVDAAQATPYPLNPAETMGNDWRWCTGLILLSVDDLDAGYVGSQSLPSGIIDCSAGPRSLRFPPLPYDVVEIGLSSLTQAHLSRLTGLGTGFGNATHGFSLMDPHTPLLFTWQSGMTFGMDLWGNIGPSLSTNELKARGWLADASILTVDPQPGGMMSQPTSGAVTLSPVFKEGRGRQGLVRLEIGPYAFEFRTPSGWDQGLAEPVVVAFRGDDARVLDQGDVVPWGSNIPLLTGGGRVEVTSITNDAATIAYWAVARPVIEAGGGVLHGNGTLLFGTDGKIHRIPPGDPAERRATQLIREIESLGEEMPEIDEFDERSLE